MTPMRRDMCIVHYMGSIDGNNPIHDFLKYLAERCGCRVNKLSFLAIRGMEWTKNNNTNNNKTNYDEIQYKNRLLKSNLFKENRIVVRRYTYIHRIVQLFIGFFFSA